MNLNDVNIVFLPDLHIGHVNIPPSRFYENICKYAYPYMEEADLIIFGGDFTDELMNMNGSGAQCMIQVINDIYHMVYTNNIQVRVLQGTSIHDRKQLRQFNIAHRHINPKDYDESPVRVYEKMSLEFNKRCNASFLYIPDDLPYKDAFARAKELLRSNSLEKVDFIVNHGYCEHLIPEQARLDKTNMFNYNQLKEICSGLVLNGHVHQPSVFRDFIISGGSFERLVHGEEHPKGFHKITYSNNQFNIEFIENKGTTPFVTVDLISHGENIDSAISKVRSEVDKYLTNLPDNRSMHLRVVTDIVEVKHAVAKDLKENYPNVVSKFKRSGHKLKEEDKLSQVELDLPTVTPENLPQLLHERLKDNVSMDDIIMLLDEKTEPCQDVLADS